MIYVRLPLLVSFAAMVASAQGALPEAPARKTVETVCGSCHEIQTAIATRRTKAGWNAVVDAMANRGARASDQEFDAIVEYLTKYVGLLNINTATASEMEDIVGLSAANAAAILRYRTENGEFADLENLKKVPGIDANLIDQRKDRIVFK